MDLTEVGTRICLLGDAVNDARLVQEAKKFNLPTLFATIDYCLNDPKNETIFIMKTFEGPIFNELRRKKSYLLGPTAVKELVMVNQPLLKRPRPTYCLSMKGLAICLAGFTDKEDADNIMSMIKYMCGSVYKECHNMSHLVSQTCLSEKYRYAVVYQKPIMSREWVVRCWERRHEVGFRADSIDMLTFKMKVFSGLYICFKKFSTEETKDMERILACYGGISVEIFDARCTHVVLNEYDYKPKDLDLLPKNAFWMKSVWFWKSIQFNIKVVEDDYLINVDKSTKMELQYDKFSAQEATGLNSTNDFRDSGIYSEESYNTTFSMFSSEYKNTERRNVFIELYQTEFNYIKLLDILQEMNDNLLNYDEEMLTNSEVNLIFGNIHPIKKLHDNLLWGLNALCVHWKEECEIGKAVQQFCRGILNAYTPFIENFETIDKTLVSCTNSRPRFYAYLQLKKLESNKQHLKDLIIRPVQRLPSMLLIIKELIEKTDKHNADYESLILAQTQLGNSLKELNTRKDKFDKYFKQFQIFKAISNSPTSVLSSTRQYILNFGAVQIESGIGNHGDILFFFLFSDIMQVCKLKRSLHLLDNSKTAETLMNNHDCPFKHLHLFSITDIKRLIDVEDTNGLNNLIIIVAKVEFESDYKRYILQLFEDINKSELLEQLHKYFSLNYARNEFIITKEKAAISANKLDVTSVVIAKKLITTVKRIMK